jgi:lycopene elongase/hydratase (dihydrobisanhydrobacterioruberin-forming)
VSDVFRVRTLGRRIFGHDYDYILFTRPRQWPILTVQFAVGILCASEFHDVVMTHSVRRLLMPGPGLWLQGAVVSWLAWVVCLNGGTLAYNSAWDRDTEDVAYLDDPPVPPRHLASVSLLLMAAAVPLAAIVDFRLALLTAFCVLLSVLYSRPRPRLKGVPGLDLLINMVGYGAGTTLGGLLVGQALVYAAPAPLSASSWFLTLGFCLLFGSFYPLTQIYQIESDRERGDRTLVSALGVPRALNLSLGLGLLAVACLLIACQSWQAPLLPLIVVLGYWLMLVGLWRVRAGRMSPAHHESWMYIALVVWALIDVVILVTRYLDKLT